jgi:hypothetical protein
VCGLKTLNIEVVWSSAGSTHRVSLHDTKVVFNGVMVCDINVHTLDSGARCMHYILARCM